MELKQLELCNLVRVNNFPTYLVSVLSHTKSNTKTFILNIHISLQLIVN